MTEFYVFQATKAISPLTTWNKPDVNAKVTTNTNRK